MNTNESPEEVNQRLVREKLELQTEVADLRRAMGQKVPWYKSINWGLIVTLVVIALIAFFAVPPIIKKVRESSAVAAQAAPVQQPAEQEKSKADPDPDVEALRAKIIELESAKAPSLTEEKVEQLLKKAREETPDEKAMRESEATRFKEIEERLDRMSKAQEAKPVEVERDNMPKAAAGEETPDLSQVERVRDVQNYGRQSGGTVVRRIGKPVSKDGATWLPLFRDAKADRGTPTEPTSRSVQDVQRNMTFEGVRPPANGKLDIYDVVRDPKTNKTYNILAWKLDESNG